jgi:hypothetical protein
MRRFQRKETTSFQKRLTQTHETHGEELSAINMNEVMRTVLTKAKM